MRYINLHLHLFIQLISNTELIAYCSGLEFWILLQRTAQNQSVSKQRIISPNAIGSIYGFICSFLKQYSGKYDIYRAIIHTTLITPTPCSLISRDVKNKDGHTITITTVCTPQPGWANTDSTNHKKNEIAHTTTQLSIQLINLTFNVTAFNNSSQEIRMVFTDLQRKILTAHYKQV